MADQKLPESPTAFPSILDGAKERKMAKSLDFPGKILDMTRRI